MTPAETITQAVRAFLKAFAHPTGTALTDAQVIASDAQGPRPPMPYLAVKVTTPGASDSQDEPVGGVSGGNPTVYVEGRRRATVSVHGFGAAAGEWLEHARLSVWLEEAGDAMEAAGFARLPLIPLGSVQDDALPRDTGIEPRFLLELEVPYRVVGRTVTQVPLQTGQVAHTSTADGSPDDARDITLTA